MAATITRTESSEKDESLSGFASSLSRSRRYCSSSPICSSSGFVSSSSTTTSFSSRSSSGGLLTGRSSSSSSPVSGYSRSSSRSSSPVRAPVMLSVDPRRSVSVTKRNQVNANVPKSNCMCSPSTHPGAFRCRMHKNPSTSNGLPQHTAAVKARCDINRLYTRRLAITNSIARSGVHAELVRKAFTSLVKPCAVINPRKPGDFKPRPSRLWKMSKAEDQ